MSVYPLGPQSRNPVAPPSDLPTPADHARFADDGRAALEDALRSTRLADAFGSGQMTREQVRRVLDRLIAVGRADVGDITRRLVDGLTKGVATLGGWFRSMVRSMIPRHYATTFGLLGTTSLIPADLEATRKQTEKQVGFLARFRGNLATGLQKLDGTAVARAEMYVASAWSIAHNVQWERMVRDGYTEAKRILGGSEHCTECPRLAVLGWVPIRELVLLGLTPCRTNCRCRISYQ